MIVRVNVALNRTVVVDGDYNNNSPIQDYVHPDDHTDSLVQTFRILCLSEFKQGPLKVKLP